MAAVVIQQPKRNDTQRKRAEGLNGKEQRPVITKGSEEFGTVFPGGQPMLPVDGSDLFFFGQVGFVASAGLWRLAYCEKWTTENSVG